MPDPLDTYKAFRGRIHERVCISSRGCTCPDEYGPEVLAEAREFAILLHRKYEHPGTVEHCESPYDVICKAVWP